MVLDFNIFLNKNTGKKAISFFANNYQDWKEKEKKIVEHYPDARCTMLPGLGYAGEYWYDIEKYEEKK